MKINVSRPMRAIPILIFLAGGAGRDRGRLAVLGSRRRVLYRQSDECFSDYHALTRIIQVVRFAGGGK